jgi:hypothetical protein
MASDGQDRAPALGWGEVVHPIRPKTFARKPTIPQKVTDVSICSQGTGLLAQRHIGEASVKYR